MQNAPHRTGSVVRVLAAAVPLWWMVVALLHPQSLTDGNAGTWLAVHVAQLVLLLALAMWALMGPLRGRSATVARVALVFWLALFSAFDAVAAFLYAHPTVGAQFSVLGSVAQPLWIVVAVAAASRCDATVRGRPAGRRCSSPCCSPRTADRSPPQDSLD